MLHVYVSIQHAPIYSQQKLAMKINTLSFLGLLKWHENKRTICKPLLVTGVCTSVEEPVKNLAACPLALEARGQPFVMFCVIEQGSLRGEFYAQSRFRARKKEKLSLS